MYVSKGFVRENKMKQGRECQNDRLHGLCVYVWISPRRNKEPKKIKKRYLISYSFLISSQVCFEFRNLSNITSTPWSSPSYLLSRLGKKEQCQMKNYGWQITEFRINRKNSKYPKWIGETQPRWWLWSNNSCHLYNKI